MVLLVTDGIDKALARAKKAAGSLQGFSAARTGIAERKSDRLTARIRNVGTFVSHEKYHVRKSLNALSVLNGYFYSLCAGRWLISYLFVTTNS